MHERRRHQRYFLKGNCFLAYASSVGTIYNISMGGLSCKCLVKNECDKESMEKGIDILCDKAKLVAQKLPVTVLGSIVVPGKSVMDVQVRKCRVQFEQLEHDQKNQLEEIILSQAIQF